MTDIPPDMVAVANRMAMPDFAAWQQQIRATGACANPIRLRGSRTVSDAATGQVLEHYSTDNEPLGYLLIACGNRRAAVCPSCSDVYRDDTYQLVRAGLTGGKGIPGTVAGHPAVFATLTAPSFGLVHTAHHKRGKDGKPLRCRVRRDATVCPHGVDTGCRMRHDAADELTGQALCLDCYDYHGAVLFNAYAGDLWRRLSIYLRRELAAAVGLSRAAWAKRARLSFVKVAEYQARGLVHFHAVIRVDGPEGPQTTPPDWATAGLLDACIRRAAGAVFLEVPDPDAPQTRTRRLAFGSQIDVQTISENADPGEWGDGVTGRAVARYVGKYVTKSAESAGATPRRIRRVSGLEYLHLPPHTERMARACFELGSIAAYSDLNLSKWAHMLGYRGHCATKSRSYSVTYGQLRQDRRDHRDAERRNRHGLPALDDRLVVIDSEWTVVRTGLSYGERPIVDAIRQRQRTARSIAARRQETT